MTSIASRAARVALFASAIVWIACPKVASAQPVATKTILVLHTYDATSQFRTAFDRVLQQQLRAHGLGDADLFVETLESYRFPGERHAAVFRDYLREKYVHHKIDVVIAVWDRALNYVLQNRDELFPDVPVVALVTRPRAFDSDAALVQVTAAHHVHQSVELALKLHPNTKRLVVVDGTHQSNDDVQTQITEQLTPFASHVAIEYLRDMPIADVVERVKALRSDSLIFFVRQTMRTRAQAMPTIEGLEQIVGAANVPTYAFADQPIGRGAVGGFAPRTEKLVEMLLARASQLMNGTNARDISVAESPTPPVFDWRQLRKWGIRIDQLPPGSEIRFREYTFWEQNQTYIAGALTVFVIQAGLIAGLVIQRSRRRRAEGALLANEHALQVSQEDSRRLAGRLIAAQEIERARIARELHDDLSQKVALLAIDINQIALSKSSDVRGKADIMAERAAEIATDLHNLSHELHPAKLQILGLVQATQYLCRDVAGRHRLDIDFVHDRIPPNVPPEPALCLFRIAQEALQNVVRHSGARRAAVTLTGSPDSLHLEISDTGGGFDLAKLGSGMGLLSMRERVNFLDGNMTIRSASGTGTRISVRVPVAQAKATAARIA